MDIFSDTKLALLHSERWDRLTCGFDLVSLTRAGTVDMSQWDMKTHEEVRAWARGEGVKLPRVLQDYVAKVEAVRKE